MEKHKNGFHSKARLFTNRTYFHCKYSTYLGIYDIEKELFDSCFIENRCLSKQKGKNVVNKKFMASENENGTNGNRNIEKLHSYGYMGLILFFFFFLSFNIHNSNMKHITPAPISILNAFFPIYLFVRNGFQWQYECTHVFIFKTEI